MLEHFTRALDHTGSDPWLIFAKLGVAPLRADLGLAHGVPGLIAFLARVHDAGVLPCDVGALINKAVPWLLSRRQSNLRLPYFDGGAEAARDAWCYGDPGVALAVLAAGRALNNPSWCSEAQAQARGTISRPVHESGVRDAGLCHGCSGLAHIFHRFFRLTGEETFRRAAVDWFQRTLDFPRTNQGGIAGYSAVQGSPSGGRIWTPAPGLLNGVSGIGLALLSALTEQNLQWDRVLLTN